MTTDQKEKRNDEYNKYVKRVTPTHCLSANMLKAFILGGIICTIGQLILNTCTQYFGLSSDEASAWCSMILGWYSPSSASNSAMVAIGTVGKPSFSSSSRPRLQITRNSIGVVGASVSRRKSVDNVDGRRVNIAYSNAAICRIASCSQFSKA